jgi:hypothetical protein
MRRRRPAVAAFGIVTAACVLAGSRGEAHKPITSPFTFTGDVFPILRAQCGGCHAEGGVAPMSLLTYAETVPWGESIRAELLSGHMPPWTVEGPRGRFHNAQALTARELNVLMTWVSGGTPPGNADTPPAVRERPPGWPLGPPDLVLPLPDEHTLAADTHEETVEFTIAVGTREPLWVRAVDLRPGTASIVRSATVRLEGQAPSEPGGTGAESVLAVWVPGDVPVALEGDAAFLLPPDAELVVSIHYRKTWEYERQAMTDRSVIGVYLAQAPAPELRAMTLAPPDGVSGISRIREENVVSGIRRANAISYTHTIRQDLRALAIYPDAAMTGARVVVTATRPDQSREELIAFRPTSGWARRYWFVEPVSLPRGTIVTVTAHLNDPLVPPGALTSSPPDPASVRLTLNVVPAA